MRIVKKSASDFVLQILEQAVDATVAVEDFTTNTYVYAGYGRNYLPKSTLSKALKRLREKGVISEIKIDNKTMVKLLKPRTLLIKNKNLAWDGVWRVIIFDIPEQKRQIRNLFRRNLKNWGFKNLQKSVWITKQDCFDDLKRIVEDLGLKQWVTVLETKRMSPLP